MKKFWLMSYCTTLSIISFLLFSLPIQAKNKRAPHISHSEFNEVINNGNERYVYLGKQFSDLHEIISQINTLEDKPNSITRELQQHIDDGFSIGLYDSVVEALSYAEKTLQRNNSKINLQEAQDIARSLEIVIDQVMNGELNIDPQQTINNNNNAVENKHCCPDFSYGIDSRDYEHDCAIITENNRIILTCPNKIKHGLKAFGKAEFTEDVIFKDDVGFKDKVGFGDKVK